MLAFASTGSGPFFIFLKYWLRRGFFRPKAKKIGKGAFTR
ncbi:hypothetical protein B4135_0055 [Caldibacillus debilis]|uniref:Uncharacterized protein n=1 Tax=Caldibacillus debilis TaxID=301148 RepID=A0A150M2S5_9BACI|nr:hypothetical protein B4135_0055 [Caldibacillus debilis]